MSECFWGWSMREDLRKNGESGGFVSSLIESLIGDYDRVISVRKTGTVFEGKVVDLKDSSDVKGIQGALHSLCINMSAYIKKGMRTAIVLKPCDAKAVIENMKRNHVDRGDVLLIGLNCGGTLSPVNTMKMLDVEYELRPDEVVKEEISKGNLIFFTEDNEFSKSIDELEESGYGRRESCRYCNYKIPSVCDIACGNWGTPAGGKVTFVEIFTQKGEQAVRSAVEMGFVSVEAPSEKLVMVRSKINSSMKKLARSWKGKVLDPIMELSPIDRLNYITNTLSPCIGCYACRKACPVCNCTGDCKCLQMDPDDVLPIPQYHAVRLLHLMESCIGCGNCTDVCPVDIPLARLHQLFAKAYEDRTGYKPGMSADDVPPLSRGDIPEGH
ncbi:MAG: Coenzyme F420 hydrogenase/dehydrogenase, beta subunit C-terminal domain [Candidatus Methanofastidiosa archaeon]|nr:Coenzyme F420 hydrogenase/dehydrogenase, beta subunit C-terminal domain [Candidatus Methanofastidiosa archaeon]